MSLGPVYALLGEVSVQVLCPFFNWVVYLPGVSRVSSLYILEIRPLSEVSLVNMFSHTVVSLTTVIIINLYFYLTLLQVHLAASMSLRFLASRTTSSLIVCTKQHRAHSEIARCLLN